MRRLSVLVLVTISIALFGSLAMGKTKAPIKRRAKANIEIMKKKGKWARGKFSTLQTKGLSIADSNSCERFDVEVLDKNLIYKIRCGRYFSSGLIPLANEKDYKIEKTENEITITKLSHYGQKIQTSQMGQSLVRIPFVEEVTFVKFLADGTLTFYKENFSVDDFGRVVQESFLQGYGLSSRTIKVGRK
jgi:hypothetical protein